MSKGQLSASELSRSQTAGLFLSCLHCYLVGKWPLKCCRLPEENDETLWLAKIIQQFNATFVELMVLGKLTKQIIQESNATFVEHIVLRKLIKQIMGVPYRQGAFIVGHIDNSTLSCCLDLLPTLLVHMFR